SVGTFDIDNLGRPITGASKPNSWVASNIGGNTIGFCAVCATGGTKIPELIIGGPSATGVYTNSGTSIRGRNGNAPFMLGSGGTYSSGGLKALDSSPSWVYRL